MQFVRSRIRFVPATLIAMLIVLLPAAVWLDWRSGTLSSLERQAKDLNSIISSVRNYYADNVVARVLSLPGTTRVVHNYEIIPGAIPIPATLSLELTRVISDQQKNISYRFVSDYPFANRAPHVLDAFETGALSGLRTNPKEEYTQASNSFFSGRVRSITPVIMGAACVDCHNSHPESPKRDWKIGDVRGIQEVTIISPFAESLFSFKFLLLYFVLLVVGGSALLVLHRREVAAISSQP